ncbi:hypothetical protein Fmac_003997 [Flemingia macrophylla]|uniref:Late embryogenesis abundant protein LEA-2 subgroup domain-containing protein n=1 Tax=Flemingia macrophylla TaxID=520843 RepID=A0ABD1N3Q2_9FABA
MHSSKKSIHNNNNNKSNMALSPDQQLKPLAPFISSTHHHFAPPQEDEQEDKKNTRIRNLVLCFGCGTALVVILVVIVLVLGFTVYNVQEPKVRLNAVTLLNGTFANNVTNNVTFLADMSVKNPNAFTFRFRNTTTTFYYYGAMIGEGHAPSGKAKARRTIKMNSTFEIIAKKLLGAPNLDRDLVDQALNISSYTRIEGKVKILNIFAREVMVEMNCTVVYNVTTGLVSHGDNCLGNVDI